MTKSSRPSSHNDIAVNPLAALLPHLREQGCRINIADAKARKICFGAGRECFFSKTVLAALALASPEVLSHPLQLATYVKELRTGDRTLAVALRDSAGNKLACDSRREGRHESHSGN